MIQPTTGAAPRTTTPSSSFPTVLLPLAVIAALAITKSLYRGKR
ncbi:hypothetical protein [Methanoregula boonei]|nr:hypothetical protein [Methanoregula boonei]